MSPVSRACLSNFLIKLLATPKPCPSFLIETSSLSWTSIIFYLNSTELGFIPNFPYLSISAKLNLMSLRIAIAQGMVNPLLG